MRLTPNQSHYVLNSLLSQRKVRASQIEAALKGRHEEIRRLREQLASLEQVEGGAGSVPTRGRRRARRAAVSRVSRRRRKMSRKVRALRRLQGKYMGYVRRLTVAEKARVRSLRENQGIEAAIRLASSLSSKK